MSVGDDKVPVGLPLGLSKGDGTGGLIESLATGSGGAVLMFSGCF